MKQKILIILFCILVILCIFIIRFRRSKENNIDVPVKYETLAEDIVSDYDEITGEYKIIDNFTGEVIDSSISEDDLKYEIEFYRQHPNYKANPPIE